MSRESHKKFLNNLLTELKKPGGPKEFREKQANKRLHTFTYNESTIKNVFVHLLTKSTLEGAGEDIFSSIESTWNKEVKKLTTGVRTSFNNIAAANPETVKVLRGSKTGEKITVRVLESGKRDNFNLIKNGYRDHLNSFYKIILEKLEKDIIVISAKGEERKIDEANKAYHLEHLNNTSNVKLFIENAIHTALNEVYTEEDIPALQEDLKNLGLSGLLRVEKNLKLGTVKVFLGSALLNLGEAGTKESRTRRDAIEKIEKALEKLKSISKLEGSDSLLTATTKKSIKTITDPFKNIPGVTVTTRDLKLKGVNTSASLRVKAGKVQKGSKNKGTISKRRMKKMASKGLASVPLAMITKLNNDLPSRIKQNMQYPALRNRTGRFAESVQIVGVVQTPKGFPSFQYTYMKYPYQTFEPGYAQGSIDRDPRTLIDKSIRELAVEYAVGRLFTRRI